jgi:hypothetical protein
VVVTDERWGRDRTTYSLNGVEAELLRLCWQITSFNRIRAELGPRFADVVLQAGIDWLAGQGLLLREDAEFLALPLRQPGWRRAPTLDEMAAAKVAVDTSGRLERGTGIEPA